MAYVLSRTRLKDYETWKAAFAGPEGRAARKAAGAKSWRIFRSQNDPNDITVLFEWNSLDNARKYYDTEAFRKKQPKVVLSDPEIFYLEEVESGTD